MGSVAGLSRGRPGALRTGLTAGVRLSVGKASLHDVGRGVGQLEPLLET